MTALQTAVLDLADARDFAFAGGKAVNLAELLGAGFPVPDGFCVGTPAYAQAADTAGIAARAGSAPDLPVRARDALLATPIPDDVAAAVTAAYTRARRGGAGRGAVVGHGRGPPGRELRGSAGHLPERGRRRRACWTRCAAAGRRSGRTGPWPTAPTRASRTRAPSSPWWCSGWSTRRPRACCSPPTRSAVGAAAACSTPRRALATPSSPARSTPTTGWSTDARSPPARPRAAASPTGRCATSSSWAAGSRRTSARRRTSSGRSTARARCGSPSRARSPRSTPCHRSAGRACACTSTPRWPRGSPARSRRWGCRRSGWWAHRSPGSPPASPSTRCKAPRGSGSRATGRSSTSPRCCATRSAARPCPRSSSVMEARSAVVVRELLADEPSLAPTRSALPGALAFARPVLRILLRYRVPALIALALARPAAARKVVAARGDQLRARLPSRSAGDGHARLAHVVTMLRAVPPIMPRTVPAAAGGFLALGLARRVAGPDLDAQAVHEVLRGLPHNVTTDMDLELWALATRLDQASTAALHAAPPAELAERFHARALPPVLQRELAAFLAEHGHRTAAEIDLGMPRWSDDPTQVLGSLANYLRITDPTDHPDARFARGAAAAEAAVARGRRRGAAALADPRAGSPASRCAARGSSRACGRRTRTTSCGCSPTPGPSSRSSAPSWPPAACSRRADDVFFLELREVAAALDGADQRDARRRPPRRVRPGAAAPPHPPGAAVRRHRAGGRARRARARGGVGRHPGLGGHRHGRRAGGARPGRRPPRAGRDPRGPVHRPRLDPAVPHRGRARDGDGRRPTRTAPWSRGSTASPRWSAVPDATARLQTGQTVTVDGAAGTVVSA